MFEKLKNYRTKLGVAAAMTGGLTLILNGVIDSISAGDPFAGTTKIGAGLLGIGMGFSAAGIRWAPQFVALIETLKMIQSVKADTVAIKAETTETNLDVKKVAAKVAPLPISSASTR